MARPKPTCGFTGSHDCLGPNTNPNGNRQCINADVLNAARAQVAGGTDLVSNKARLKESERVDLQKRYPTLDFDLKQMAYSKVSKVLRDAGEHEEAKSWEAKAQSGTPAANPTTAKPQVPAWNAPAQPRPQFTDPWALYESFRDKYKQNRPALNANTVHDLARGGTRSRLDPTRPSAQIPYHVQRAKAELNNFICPVLGLREGQVIQVGGKAKIVTFVPDHIVPEVEGGLTVDENIRMISMVANGMKNKFNLTDDQILARYSESGYSDYEVPPEDLAVLSKYGVFRFSTAEAA